MGRASEPRPRVTRSEPRVELGRWDGATVRRWDGATVGRCVGGTVRRWDGFNAFNLFNLFSLFNLFNLFNALDGGTVRQSSIQSSARDDFDDFQTVSSVQLPAAELGRCDGLAVVLDHNAFGKKFLGDQKLLDAAGKIVFNFLAVGDDSAALHHAELI